MFSILKLFFDICLLRANAEDIPSSKFLLAATVLIYFILSVGVTLIDHDIFKSILIISVGLMMTMGFAYAGLWVRSYLHRFNQTFTAMAGSGIVLQLLSWPFKLLSAQYSPEQLTFPIFMLIMFLFWNIAIFGHILKSALAIPFWAGAGISVLFVFTFYNVIVALFYASP